MQKLRSIFYILILISSTHTAMGAISETIQDNAQIIAEVKGALSEKGIKDKLKININKFQNGLKLKDELSSYKISIGEISLNEKNQSFKADVILKAENNKVEYGNITGTYEKTLSVPVLVQRMPRDAVIHDSDITWAEFSQDQIKFDTITSVEKLVGQSLKRGVTNSMPLKEQDLQKIQIMARNSIVNILFDTPYISLKTIGIALDNGGQGDIIRVRNSSSNKIIQAVVQDDQNVAALSQSNSLTGNKTAAIKDKNYVR